MIDRFINDDEDPLRIIGRYAVSVVLRIVYGLEVRDDDGSMRYVEIEECTSESLANEIMAGGGVWAVDMMPWRESQSQLLMRHSHCNLFDLAVRFLPSWVPGAGFQKKATAWKKDFDELREAPFAAVKEMLVFIFDYH